MRAIQQHGYVIEHISPQNTPLLIDDQKPSSESFPQKDQIELHNWRKARMAIEAS
jgi:hypothetical protein